MRAVHPRTWSSIGAAIAATFLLLSIAAPAVAGSPPQPVSISSTMVIGGDFNTGTFVKEAGSDLVCADGLVTDTRYVWGAPRGVGSPPQGLQLQVDKQFDCGDGLISFRLQVHGVYATETFSWVILGGTGAYAGLHGRGDGWTDSSDYDTCTCVVNHYSGFLIR